MVSNKAILDKIREKAKGDERAYSVLIELLEIEREHKQYNKAYKTIIERDVKEANDED